MISHTKTYGIYHWDTFESPGEDTFLVDEADTLAEAEQKIKDHYGNRVRATGADRVQVVDQKGKVVRSFNVG